MALPCSGIALENKFTPKRRENVSQYYTTRGIKMFEIENKAPDHSRY